MVFAGKIDGFLARSLQIGRRLSKATSRKGAILRTKCLRHSLTIVAIKVNRGENTL